MYRIGDILEPEEIPVMKDSDFVTLSDTVRRIRVVGTVSSLDTVILSSSNRMIDGVGFSLKEILESRSKLRNSFLMALPDEVQSVGKFAMIYLNEDVNEEKVSEICYRLRNYGSAYTVKELREGTKEIMDSKMRRDRSTNILIIFVLMTGIISLSILSTKKTGIRWKFSGNWAPRRRRAFAFSSSAF